jgi:hypothetical protein
MLVLLSAPRGRVSAARVAACIRERAHAEAHGTVDSAPRALAAPAEPEYRPRARPAAAEEPAQSWAAARPPLS